MRSNKNTIKENDLLLLIFFNKFCVMLNKMSTDESINNVYNTYKPESDVRILNRIFINQKRDSI